MSSKEVMKVIRYSVTFYKRDCCWFFFNKFYTHIFLQLQGLNTAKQIGALVYSETSSKSSQRSVNDVMEVAALSSAGSKNGCSFTAHNNSGTTTTVSNSSTGSSANSNSSSDSPNFRRQRSFIRRKRFTGMNEAKVHLRKEAAKSCAVM